jgi:LacI family transcriptional regulator
VGVENAAAALGLTTVTCNTHGSPQSEMEYVEVLLRQRADGIVFTAPLAEESVRRVRESGVPVCIVERPKGIRDVDVVLVDNQAGARDATEHLIAQGHRAIAYIGDECTDIVEGQRLAGYREAIERAGLEPRDDLIRLGDGELEHGRRAMGELLRLARRPTAAFGAGDLYAIGALQALWEAGFRVPDDMSVVGFDDTLAAVAIPPLTTVVLPMREMGNAAVALLHRRLTTNSEPDAEAVVLATRLVVRQSTAPCPSQQPARR